jgi:hypothetical protein
MNGGRGPGTANFVALLNEALEAAKKQAEDMVAEKDVPLSPPGSPGNKEFAKCMK